MQLSVAQSLACGLASLLCITAVPAAAAGKPASTAATAGASVPAAAPLANIRWTGVTIVTQQPGAQAIRYGDLVVREGRIICIGTSRPAEEPGWPLCPPTPELPVRDMAGNGWIVPAFVDLIGHVGLVEVNSESGAQDGQSVRPTIAAHVRVADALRLSMRSVTTARRGGVGFVLAEPQGPAVLSGHSVLARTLDRADSVQLPAAALHVQVGDATRRDESTLGSRSGVHAWLRDTLAKGRRLQAGLRKPPADPAERSWLAEAKADSGLVALANALERGTPIFARAHRKEDIAALIRLATEQQLPLVITGGAEAHLLATELAAAKIAVVLGPVRLRPDDFANRAATVQAAAILHRAGVRVALASADSHNNRHLRWEAGYAAEAGLPPDAALAAITSVPAAIVGLPALGQLRVGALADLVVLDGPPLTLQGHVTAVMSGGELELAPRQP